jgi:hypothetical protein
VTVHMAAAATPATGRRLEWRSARKTVFEKFVTW